MNRSQKEELVVHLRETFLEDGFLVLVSFKGLTVSDSLSLRRALCGVGGRLRIVKNTLLSKAFENTKGSALLDFIQGSTGLVWGKDIVGLSKAIAGFKKQVGDKFSYRAALLEGDCLQEKEIGMLSDLPSLEVLRSQLLGLMLSSGTGVVRIISEVPSALVRVCAAHSSGSGH
jgi:large subunit ribosomal protein L10